MNLRVASSTLLCSLLASAAASAVQAPPAPKEYTALKPGLWEIRTSTQMLNMPVELPPVPYKAVQCLTQEQLNNQENLTAVSGAQGECQILDANVTEQQTTWHMTCKKNGMDFNAKGSITPISLDTYTGNVRFTMSGNPNMPPMNGVTTLQGTWQGECTGRENNAGVEPIFKASPVAPVTSN